MNIARHVRSALVLLFLPAVGMSEAAPTTGTLQATARIESGCRVVGQTKLTQGIDLGVLNFGQRPSIFATALTASSQGALGTVQLTCTGSTSVDVSINTGLYVSGNQRQLGSGTHRVPYDLYVDSTFNTPFVGNTARTLTVSANGASTILNMPIYGRVQPTPGGYAPGSYQDVLQITVAW